MPFGERWRRFFSRRQVSLGWSLLWRLLLVLLPLRLLGELVARGEATGSGPAAGAGAVAALFALPVGGNVYLFPLVLPVMLAALNWIGKRVARRRLESEVAGFIGWSIYWRWALLQLAGVLTLGLVLTPIMIVAVKMGGPSRSGLALAGVLGLLLVPVLVIWSLNGAGWALLRAIRRPARVGTLAAAVAGAETDGPIRDWTRLFDRERYGFNGLLAGAYAFAIILLPWIARIVPALLGEPFDAPGLSWYPIYVMTSLLEGAAFGYLSHRLKNDWHLPPAMAAVAIILMLVEVAASRGGLEPWFLLSSAAHGLLVAGGLVAGVRLLGAGLPGFLAGVGCGLLAWGLLVHPVVLNAAAGIGPMPAEWYLTQAVTRLLQAALFAGLLYAAVQWHLRRRGLRLRRGSMSPAVVTSP